MSEKRHILVIDDDERLIKLLQKFLRENGFFVSTASSADEARKRLSEFSFDMLIVDIMMPGESGLSFTKHLRETSQIPIIMLTAMGETEDRINGLSLGVDDYISKPFEPRELILRINAVLKRIQKEKSIALSELKLGECLYNVAKKELTRLGSKVHLTPAEETLLAILAESPGKLFSRESLGEKIGSTQNLRTVDVQVTRLRKKIEPDTKIPRYIQTIRGKGYKILPD